MITLKPGQTPDDFLAAARRYMGVPFRHRGRTRFGIDCAGLLILSLRDMGLDPYDVKVYGREPARDGLRQAVERNMGQAVASRPVNEGDIQAGDVLLICFNKEPHHLAIAGVSPYTDESGGHAITMIHTFGDVGKVVEHRMDQAWLDKVLEVYRLKKAA